MRTLAQTACIGGKLRALQNLVSIIVWVVACRASLDWTAEAAVPTWAVVDSGHDG